MRRIIEPSHIGAASSYPWSIRRPIAFFSSGITQTAFGQRYLGMWGAGARRARDQDPAPLSMESRWGRDHDLAPHRAPSISSAIPSRSSFLRSVALPICAGARASGSRSRSRPLYQWDRDGGGIMISLPSHPLYHFCDSVAFKFPMVGRVTHTRELGKIICFPDMGARRERDQDPGGIKIPPPVNGIAMGAGSRSRPHRAPIATPLSRLRFRRVQVF